MFVLWALEKGFVKDIIDQLPKPKPAYNTVSTIVRILEKKGFVDHNSYGNSYEYFPVVQKKDYTKAFLKNFVRDYFSDSFTEMVSFFAKDKDMSLDELEEIKNRIIEEINKQKKDEHE